MGMRLPSAFEKAEFLYLLIALASAFAVLSVAAHALSETRPDVYSAWLEYPQTVTEGGSVDFKLFIKNEGTRAAEYSVGVFADGTMQASDVVTSAPNSTASRPYSVPNSFLRGSEHQIKVGIFKKGEPYDSYGSENNPYNLFFTVRVL